jgi:hypothetical protein
MFTTDISSDLQKDVGNDQGKTLSIIPKYAGASFAQEKHQKSPSFPPSRE